MSLDHGSPSATQCREQAKALLREKQAAEAAELLRQHLDAMPGEAEDYLLLGVALGQTGQGLQAIQVLEGAADLAPDDPTIQYNLGLLYRQAGRVIDATAALQCAVELRPDYDQAARALAALGGGAPAAGSAAPPAADGARKCPHCGMETKALLSCEWCSRPLVTTPVVRPDERGAPVVAAMLLSNADNDELESGSLGARRMRAAWMVISDPTRAVNGGLEIFINSRGAALAVLGLYLLSLLPAMFAFAPPEPPQPGVAPEPSLPLPLLGLAVSLAALFISSFIIAVYNSMTGGSDTFIGDFGSLVLSFAFVTATITFFCLPVTLPLVLMGNTTVLGLGGLVLLAEGLWVLILEVMIVVASADINGFAALVLLSFANGVARFATGSFLMNLMRDQ